MVRKTFAVALLCLTLLFCGLDSSPVGHPAEAETALHALSHRHDSGTDAATTLLAAAALVALGCVALVTASRPSPIQRRRTPTETVAKLTDGWIRRGITRGPPARA
jgi:hypothetical protein